MSPKTKIFALGVTGYIGGAVLTRLLAHPDARKFDITALVRSAPKARQLEAFGVTAIVGSLADVDQLELLASQSDVVIALADADDLDAAKALLRGAKKRFEATGKTPALINTSGTGVLTDDARGLERNNYIYDDSNADQIESIVLTQPHRVVDVEIVSADKAGYVKTYIILPGTIYGIAKGKLFDLGISNRHSQQVPALIKASIDRGQGGIIGKGLNVWPNVEIHEVADLYIRLYDSIGRKFETTGHGREGYYFAASDDHELYDVGKAISAELVDIGKGKTAIPTPFTEDEIKKYFGSWSLGSNSRCIANHSFSIGWKPTKRTTDLLASVKPEVAALIQKQK